MMEVRAHRRDWDPEFARAFLQPVSEACVPFGVVALKQVVDALDAPIVAPPGKSLELFTCIPAY